MRAHILGIGGVFMGNLALLLRDLGWHISGSDSGIYPPMSHMLAEAGVEVLPYDPALAGHRVDMFVVGNSVLRGNPLLEALLDQGLTYTSGPALLAQAVLRGRQVLAIAGTHGKTTCTSLAAHCLQSLKLDAGFLLGGSLRGGRGSHLGTHKLFVVEADEYDSAFCDKRAKFVHYCPRWALLNNLEFDHADIYPNLAAIETQFHHLVRTMPAGGAVIYPAGDQALGRVIQRGCWSSQVQLGRDWQCTRDGQSWQIVAPDGQASLQWQVPGEHNAHNALGVLATLAAAGVDWRAALEAMHSFSNAARRMEKLGETGGAEVYTDFAHHPSAIAATLKAFRQLAGDRRMLVVLHPASNTMRSHVHAASLCSALEQANLLWLYQPDAAACDFTPQLRNLPGWQGSFASATELAGSLGATSCPGDMIISMSNGAIAGLHQAIFGS